MVITNSRIKIKAKSVGNRQMPASTRSSFYNRQASYILFCIKVILLVISFNKKIYIFNRSVSKPKAAAKTG